ncbi:hypothetical protein ACH9L7_17245 (plasmid) [Haloferax sp. S1W]|uniref:hypothetical protein n=1 Tax=Haloferax sp. S1W TaxID=3377110 RepID=UPI0037C57D37
MNLESPPTEDASDERGPLAETIESVLDDPVADARLRARAEDFSVPAVTTAYESHVTSLVERE